MENGLYALLPLLGILALIKRVRDNWYPKSTETKLEERQTPSFQLPDKKGELLRDPSQHKEYVWSELLNLHRNRNWRFGVYETELYVESTFTLSENKDELYRYLLYGDELHFDVVVTNTFPPEVTTDLFVLAAHFNNLLTFGKVIVNTQNRNVVFTYQNEVSLYALYPEKIEQHLSRHYHISKDVHWAFEKFLEEREEPAIIIGDLMNIQKNRGEKSEGE
jgi:hypothetical protein